MISITETLQAAADAKSRAPLLNVTIERTDLELVEIHGLSLPYNVHRFQKGSDYWFATAVDTGNKKIYYRKFTQPSLATEWNSGWTLLATATVSSLFGNGVYNHDMIVDGAWIVVIWEQSDGVVYFSQSSDSGSNFSSPAEAYDFSSSFDRSPQIAIGDRNAFYVHTFGGSVGAEHLMYRLSRTSEANPWSLDGEWDCGKYFFQPGEGSMSEVQRQVWAIELESGDHRIVCNMRVGYPGGAKIFPSEIRNRGGKWATVNQVLGVMPVDLDYYYTLGGISRQLNGFFFAGIGEQYLRGADSDGPYYPYEEDFFLARTTDGISYSLVPINDIPIDIHHGMYIAGVAECENGNYIVIPINEEQSYGEKTVCLTPASSWFGCTPSALDVTDHVLDNINISYEVRTSAKTSINLSNIDDRYTDHDIVKAGSVVRISGGYTTASGNEMQQRFTGQVTSMERASGGRKAANVNLLDLFNKATAIKQIRPHLYTGQNVFHCSFSDELDLDNFVLQSGAWSVEDGELVTEGHNLLVAYAGYEPDDAHVITAKVRCEDTTSGQKFGLVAHGITNEEGRQVFRVFRYNGAGELEYAEYHSYSDDWLVGASYSWSPSADTNYWLMAIIKHGAFNGYFSTNGITWTKAIGPVSFGYHAYTSTLLGSKGYAGLYSEVYSDSVRVCFDDVNIFSLHHPITHSDGMKRLAGISGLETNEILELDEDFSGTSFSERWDTPGIDGTWSVSGGYARATTSGDYAMLRSDHEHVDIVARCKMVVDNVYTGGILVRGDSDLENCYAGVVRNSYAYLLKRDGGSWSSLHSRDLYEEALTTGDEIELAIMARGGYLSFFVNDILLTHAYDSDFTSGYSGIITDDEASSNVLFNSFTIDAWWEPLDVLTVMPDDDLNKVMGQLADIYKSAQYFVNYEGKLTWGIFDDDETDLDARSIGGPTLSIDISIFADEILSAVRSVGDNCYAEERMREWGAELLGYRYGQNQDESAFTKQAARAVAEKILEESQKIRSHSVTMRGQPALELCDVVTTAENEGDFGLDCKVLAFDETIGNVYITSISDLEQASAEAAPSTRWTPESPTIDGEYLTEHWYCSHVSLWKDWGYHPANSDGDYIARWDDLASNGDWIYQPTWAYRPVYRSKTSLKLNGYPIVYFDGTNDCIRGPFSSPGFISQPCTMFIVARMDADAVNDGNDRALLDGYEASYRHLFYQDSAQTPDKFALNAGSNLVGSSTDSSWHIWTILVNGASSQIWRDGVSVASGNAGSQNLSGLTIGAAYDGTKPFKGGVVTGILYGANLSTVDKNLVGNFLAETYSLGYTDI